MSTDKTLADVQPGGRVRLGDQAELDRHEFQAWTREMLPCPFCGNDAEFVPYKNNGLTLKCKSMGCIQRHQRTLRYGIDWLRTSMAEHWNTRALSARQPVYHDDEELQFYREHVGNDLDNMLMASGVFEAQHEGGYAACWANSMEALKRLIDRQPVGEPAAWMHTHKATGRVKFGLSPMYDCDFNAARWDSAALYAAPAQAVDLGQFRPFVEAQRAEYISHGLTEEDYCVAECDELLALIDSQAVGE